MSQHTAVVILHCGLSVNTGNYGFIRQTKLNLFFRHRRRRPCRFEIDLLFLSLKYDAGITAMPL